MANLPTRPTMAAVVDLNGVLRGKRLSGRDVAKAMHEGVRMPLSIVGVDIWGRDIEDSPQVYATGDADGHFLALGPDCKTQNWLEHPSDLLPLTMVGADLKPNGVCPRGALWKIAEMFKERGLTIVAASELEFHLVRRGADGLLPDGDGRSGESAAIECVDSLQAREAFFADIYDATAAWDIDVGAAMSEAGPGQFEINLNHGSDIMRIADSTYYFKRIVRGIAEKHGLEATFMAKPFGEEVGNGLHIHMSVLDARGQNIFDNGGEKGTTSLLNAISGLERTMADFMILFAPHLNSYRRFVRGSFAPTKIAWGYDNRLSALRVPHSDPKARRIEHRVAGADANPYLVLAGLLGGVLLGLDDETSASDPISGNAYAKDRPLLPNTWLAALDCFKQSTHAEKLFDPRLIRMLVASKEQEIETFAKRMSRFEYETYVDSV